MTTRRPGSQPPPLSVPPAPSPLPTQAVPPPPAALRSAAAPHRANRKRFLLSVLVVLLAGVLAAAAGKQLSSLPTVLVVARPVPMGAVITDADLATSSGTNDQQVSSILAERRADVVGKVALVPLSKGQLIAPSQLGTSDGFAPGQLLVALALKPGQLPSRGLAAGDKVLIIQTPGANAASSAGDASKVGSRVRAPIEATVATASSTDEDTNLSIVDVRVSTADAGAVADISSTGNLAVLLRPVGG